jgi:hypothetical protein
VSGLRNLFTQYWIKEAYTYPLRMKDCRGVVTNLPVNGRWYTVAMFK